MENKKVPTCPLCGNNVFIAESLDKQYVCGNCFYVFYDKEEPITEVTREDSYGPFMHKFELNQPEFKKIDELGEYTYQMIRNVKVEAIDKIDDYIVSELIKLYKETDLHTLIVIDKAEFEKFLRKYLPIYMEELNNA